MRRDSFDIYVDILKCAEEEIRKSHIVKSVGLGSDVITKYLDILLDKCLMEKHKGVYYRTTEKGKKFLEDAKEVLSIFQQ